MKRFVFTLFFVFSILFFGSNPTFAQPVQNATTQTTTSNISQIYSDLNKQIEKVKTVLEETLKPELVVDMFPENPGPNQSVTISIASYNSDLNSSKITWELDGRVRKEGAGEKTFTFTTGDISKTQELSITIETVDGQTSTQNIKIKPTLVDIVWQSDGFVPPFYKGKSVFSYQNKITFIAIPHIISSSGVEVSPKNLIYKWKVNGSVVDNASGYGKNTYTTKGALIARPMNVTVEVSSPNVTGVGFGIIAIEAKDPEVILYKKNALYGVEFQKALTGEVDISENKEINIVSFPLFFGENYNSSNLSYKWLINGVKIDNDLGRTSRVFRPKEGTSGSSKISLLIENSDKILQSSRMDFYLKFSSNEKQPSGF